MITKKQILYKSSSRFHDDAVVLGFAVCKIFLEWGLLRFHEQVLHDLRKWLHHAVWERKKNPQNYEKYCKIF